MKKCIVITAISVLALTACNSHENPLEKMTKQEQANFLADASRAAEKALQLHDNSYAYRDCMEGKLAQPTCEPLFQKMVAYGHQRQELRQLKIADINNAHYWLAIKSDYLDAAFNSLPD